jgi:hypothetical protein
MLPDVCADATAAVASTIATPTALRVIQRDILDLLVGRKILRRKSRRL